MRLQCFFCGKAVSNDVPDDTVVRAALACPECVERGKVQVPDGGAGDSWTRLEHWLDEDPEINWVEVAKNGGAAPPRYAVQLWQTCPEDEQHPLGKRCVADAESATLPGAVDGALLLAREFREGHS